MSQDTPEAYRQGGVEGDSPTGLCSDSNLPILSRELTEIYRPLAVIGAGAYAMVIRAEDKRNGRPVAIKHFQLRVGDRKKFFREMTLTMSFDHPHITKCLDIFTASDSSCDLILECADRGNLREMLFERPVLPLQDAFQIATHVARGLAHAHADGVIHRDIKPENVLVFQQGNGVVYKLTDFGIAKLIGAHAQTLTSIGSPAYMAPEQFYDRYGLKSDVYALGVLLYELIHGDCPFEGSPANIFRGHLEASPEIREDLPEGIRELLTRLLGKKEEDRPSAAEALEELSRLRREVASQVSGSRQVSSIVDPPAREKNVDPGLKADDIFGSMFGEREAVDEAQTPVPPPRPRVPLVSPPPATAEPSAPGSPPVKRHDTREDVFSEGFEDADQRRSRTTTDLSEVLAHEQHDVGRLVVTRLWSRAMDTAANRLVCLEDSRGVLVVAKDTITTVNSEGQRGRTIYEGPITSLGVPCGGVVPVVRNDEVISVGSEGDLGRTWYLKTERIKKVVLAPSQSFIAIALEHTVHFHDAKGNLLWTAQLPGGSQGTFVCFDENDRLMMLTLNSPDHAVRFYDEEGRQLAEQWMPGPISAATRCRSRAGAWVVANRQRHGPFLLRVAVEGIAEGCPLAAPLSNLTGAVNWIAGRNEDGGLIVVDPSTGASAVVEISGTILDYEQGDQAQCLFVLEQRGSLLKYITAYQIGRGTPAQKG